MTVEITNARQSFSGTGASANYTPGIYAQTADQIVVTVDGVTTNTYTLSGLRDPAGIVVTGTFPNGSAVVILRRTAKKQEVDTVDQSTILEDVLDDALDKSMMIDQEISDSVSDLEARAVRVPVGETIAVLPPPNDRKGTLFGFSLPTGIRELLTYANVSTLLAPFLAPLLSAIHKGDPGGNIMAIGLFLAGSTLNIPVGTNVVRTSGYSADGKGGALYQNDDATVNAAYVLAHPRDSFISANGRGFRLSLDQQHKVTMFGAVGDNTANDGTAFVAAIAFSYANRQTGTGAGAAGPSLAVPFGKYYLGAQTLDFTHTVDFFGDGGGWGAGAASQMRWDAVTGLRTQTAGTTGATTTGAQTYPGGAGSTFSNLFLKGGYAGTEGEFHAFHMRAKAFLNNIFIDNWPGDGVAIIAGADAYDGNSNSFILNRVMASNCRNGVHCKGSDSNRGRGWVDVSNNRWCGILDQSFLGNTWEGICENTGKIPGVPPTMVSHGGNWFAAIWGQEAGAATNAPPLTQTDNTWWYYVTPGAAFPSLNVPDWVSGIVVRPGGPIVTDNNNASTVIFNFGTELYQPPMQIVWPTIVFLGWDGAGVKGTGQRIGESDSALEIARLHIAENLVVGPATGPAVNPVTCLDMTGDRHALLWRAWAAGVPTGVAEILGKTGGGGLLLTGDPGVSVYVGSLGAPIPAADFTADGMNIPNDTPGVSGYYVGGLKVVGARASAIGNPATIGAAPTQADHNSLAAVVISILDVMRADGKISL